jgi:DNA-binding CsgD family transcriptional regulator
VTQPLPKAGTPMTRREIQVIELVARGMTNGQIGDRIGISVHTVKFHMDRLLAKLNAPNRVCAAVIWSERGPKLAPKEPAPDGVFSVGPF